MSQLQPTTSKQGLKGLQGSPRSSRKPSQKPRRVALLEEVQRVRVAIATGALSERAHTGGFEDTDWELLTEINAMLESLTRPLSVAIKAFEQVKTGEPPERITESFQGELKSLELSINTCAAGSEGLREILDVLQKIAQNDFTCNIERTYPGKVGELSMATNQALTHLRHAVKVLHHVAQGDFRRELNEAKSIGKRSANDTFTPAFIQMMEAVTALVDDSRMLTEAAVADKFDTRADSNRHLGEFRQIIEGVNRTLDVVVDKLAWYRSVIDAVPLPIHVIDENMNSVFLNKAIENSLAEQGQVCDRRELMGRPCSAANASVCNTEKCGIAQLKKGVPESLVEWCGMRGKYHTGHLINIKGQNVGYVEVFEDLTASLTTHEYAERTINQLTANLMKLAKGDLTLDLTTGEANKYTAKSKSHFDMINASVGALKNVVEKLFEDTRTLTQAAIEGRLSTRADASRHQGEFRRIVEAMNATLDAMSGPVADIETELAKLAGGDFTVQLEKQYAGDFNKLKLAVNTMVTQVRSALLKIGKETDHLASASEQLGQVSQQMSASASDTASQASVVSAASEQVSTNIQTVATGADEMGASIKEIAKNTADATKIANNAVQLSKMTNETVRKLGASSAEIGQVIKVITSIAQQTNLLALNATIEAARAGEAGKGFAVVANEVKELAKQTAQATEDISQKIQAIQHDAGGAVTAIAEITEVIGQISDIQNTVATAIEEQSVTTNEISRNLAEAAKGGADITLNIASLAQVAKTTTEAARQTESSANSLEETASQLRELVGQFRYEGGTPMSQGR